MIRSMVFGLAGCLVLTLGACADQPSGDADGHVDAGAAAPTAASAAPSSTGTVIEVRAITDAQGNRFEPAVIEAKPGDILRVVLESGVHNLSFPADSNPGGTGLPPATDMLQLPGQTVDIPLTMAPGDHYFQCDPHAALGMTGKLEIEE